MPNNSPYTMVRANYYGKTLNAYWFDVRTVHGSPRRISVPRSLIHGADERHIASLTIGDACSFRLMDWKVRELDL